MLEKTIDLIVKYVSLKEFQMKDNNHHFVNEAIIYLENKILGEIETDKIRQAQIEKDRKRIELKQKKRGIIE